MSRAKEVKWYKTHLKGSLTDDDCQNLEKLIEIDSRNEAVTDLETVIYDLDDEDVDTIISDMEKNGELSHQITPKMGKLRPEQTVGVAYLYYVGNCILGDSVGMGKTVEISGLYNLLKSEADKNNRPFRMLLLTEKNLSAQTRKEMIKFTGDFFTLIANGELKTVGEFALDNPVDESLKYSVVGTHALLTTGAFLGWLQVYTQKFGFPFDLLVVDESSPLGSPKRTQMVEGFKALAHNFKRIVFLNATPFETKLEIFFNQLNLLDKEFLPTKEIFKKRFCIYDYRGMTPKFTGKYKNQEDFREMIKFRYLARTRRDKGAVMKDCSGAIIYSPLSQKQKDLLKITQMKQVVYDCPNYLDEDIEFNEENVPKLKSLGELIDNNCKDATSILIFVYHKEAQTQLSKWLTEKGISNQILNETRQSIIQQFKNGEYRILITNVQKGLNFGSCNHCIFYSFDANPSKMIQFEGRTTRDFDIIGKNVWVLCSEGEEKKRLEEVVKQRAKATADLTNTDISVIMQILLSESEKE